MAAHLGSQRVSRRYVGALAAFRAAADGHQPGTLRPVVLGRSGRDLRDPGRRLRRPSSPTAPFLF